MPTKLTVVMMVVGACLAATAAPLRAHHAFAAEFDAKKPVHFTGTVTKMEWTNPHVWLHMDVKKPGHRRELGVRSGNTERALPARLHEGFAEAGDAGYGRWLSGQERVETGERSRPDVPRRPQAVSRLLRDRRAVRVDAK